MCRVAHMYPLRMHQNANTFIAFMNVMKFLYIHKLFMASRSDLVRTEMSKTEKLLFVYLSRRPSVERFFVSSFSVSVY